MDSLTEKQSSVLVDMIVKATKASLQGRISRETWRHLVLVFHREMKLSSPWYL